MLKGLEWYKRLWYRDRGMIARLFCLVGLHLPHYNINGYTMREFTSCGRCLKDLGEWDNAT